jgi:hypothetical protein
MPRDPVKRAARAARYNKSKKGKAAQARYWASPKGKTNKARYAEAHPGRHYTVAAIKSDIKRNASRRGNR